MTASQETFNILLTAMREIGARSIYCFFSGGGDSGAIEDIAFSSQKEQHHGGSYDKNHEAKYHYVTVKSREHSWNPETRRHEWVEEPKRKTLYQAFEQFIYDALEDTDVDWCNNEGGFGTFRYDIEDDEFEFEVNVNIVETQTEFFTNSIEDLGLKKPKPKESPVLRIKRRDLK